MTILVVTAVDLERDAVVRDLGACEPLERASLRGLSADTAAGQLHAFAGGIGPVAAGITTARLLTVTPYDLVVSAGIAGGFRGRAAVGCVAVASEVTFADLGVRTDDAFLALRDMGLTQETGYDAAGDVLAQRLRGAPVEVVQGQILTLACMTGTDPAADELVHRYPSAVAEAMEGFGVADAVARTPETPARFAEVRAISNLIGRRDRSTWNMAAALDALSRAFAVLVKEPLP